MRQASEWTEDDLFQLVKDQTQENTGREYKQCDKLRGTKDKIANDVSKHVSAMANAAGGVIVYGIKEERHLPKSLDDGFDPAVTTREWLDQIIHSNIKPTPEGVLINPVELTGPRAGKVAYVVAVPKSPRGWQANDRRYWRRHNTTIYAMEDHEVRELMHRSDYPDVLFEIGRYKAGRPNPQEWHYPLIARLTNTGPVSITNWKVVMDVPSDYAVKRGGALDGFHPDINDDGRAVYRCEFKSQAGEPLFPEEKKDLLGLQGGVTGRWTEITLLLTEQLAARALDDGDLAICWVVYADNMGPKRGVVPLRTLFKLQTATPP